MINLIILGLLAAAILYTCYFIYLDVYGTLDETGEMITLKSNIEWYDLDLPSYERAKSLIALKETVAPIPAGLKNVFFYGANASPATSTYGTSTKP